MSEQGNVNSNIEVAFQENGAFYLRPGLTVGQLLQIAEALRTLALNVTVNPDQPGQTEPA